MLGSSTTPATVVDAAPAVRWFLTVAFGVGLPFASVGAARLWRHQTTLYDDPPTAWPYSPSAWRAFVRSTPAQGIAFAAMCLVVLYLLWGPPSHTVARIVLIAALSIMALGILVGACAALWNRPRWASPAHVRTQPGLIAEWRAGWRELHRRPS